MASSRVTRSGRLLGDQPAIHDQTIQLDDTGDVSVYSIDYSPVIDLTEEDGNSSVSVISPVIVDDQDSREDFRRRVKEFLNENFNNLAPSEVDIVTFRNIKELWREKTGVDLKLGEKRILKEMSRHRMFTTSSAALVDLTNSPSKSIESPVEGTGIHCPVCLDSVADIKRNGLEIMSTTCGHIFCSTCLHASLESGGGRCPTCRHKISSKGYHRVFL